MVLQITNLISEIELLPVILSGGIGTRLWPVSRSSFPKQYLNFDKENNYTLLQNTYLRLKGLSNLKSPIIICNEEQRFLVSDQMKEISVNIGSILLEPFGKNTAPAIALASLISIFNGKDPLLLILSSDHKIKDINQFQKSINIGREFAINGRIVTFGVDPTYPATGYGYIESFDEINNLNKSSDIKNFIEKPNLKVAKNLLKDNHFLWNSGIFLAKASTIISELEEFNPNVIEICRESLIKSSKDLNFIRLNKEIFEHCPNVSIDKALMEKTKLGTVVNLNAGWNDLGSWKSVWEEAKTDENQNNLNGNIFAKDVKNSYLESKNRLLVGLGLENILVVDTDDALLVAKKDAINSLKDLVKELEKKDFPEIKFNKKVHRPWGNYTTFIKGETWLVKRLEINPNESLSLQLHNFRSEHWVVVKGIAKVQIEEKIIYLNTNESIYVPLGSKHRLSNDHDELLILIEVQSGNYLGEDDIIRFDDKYKRNL